MTDQMIPAEKVRAARDLHLDAAEMPTIDEYEREIHRHVADALTALLPAPTLADMPDGERAECQWMQADVKGETECHIILTVGEPGLMPLLLSRSGVAVRHAPHKVTPRPDLPRMEWPGSEPDDTEPEPEPEPEPALEVGAVWHSALDLADAVKESGKHVTVEDATGDRATYDGEKWSGLAVGPYVGELVEGCGPWTVTDIRGKHHREASTEPEPTLKRGAVWYDPAALTRAARESARNVIVRDIDGDTGTFNGVEWLGKAATAGGALVASGGPWTITTAGEAKK